MEEKVFKQRYHLKKKLGSGRMADVYLAEDLQLSREVAVKILYSQLAVDPSYIQKLEAELPVAAELDNPNIAKTYDWGKEGDLYYVVTEYVEGRSLKEVLSSEVKLPSQRAARVASDVCGALQLAHSRSLVHGGITTHNIFITEIGQVKVMDIGMAWTASGRGTPQYISPEQAQGLAMDGRSDIYSLGIVLYEMLTGGVPFDGPSPEDVIHKQVNEVPVAPSVIDPAIPAALNALVMKALAKNPALRFQSAGEMKADLLRLLEGVPAPAAAAEEEKPSRAWAWVTVAVVGVLAITGIVLALVFTGGGGEAVQVPDVVGMSEDDARETLENAGLKMEKGEDQYIGSESQKAGVVASQDPAEGTDAQKGDKIEVSLTVELKMPNVIGMSKNDAVDALKDQKITIIEIDKTPVEEENKIGKVISQNPAAGTLATPETNVKLEVGVEATTVTVPNVAGMEEDAADKALKDAGLDVKVEEETSPTVPKGEVIRQNPLSGQVVDKGTRVTIVVSKGPS